MVLPLPVCEATIQSPPCSAVGTKAAWTGVGWVKPNALMLFNKDSAKPISAKEMTPFSTDVVIRFHEMPRTNETPATLVAGQNAKMKFGALTE